MSKKLKLIAHGYQVVLLSISVLLTGCQNSNQLVEPAADVVGYFPSTEDKNAYVPSNYELLFSSEKIANANRDSTAIPLKIRVFQLRSNVEFLEADFFSLQEDEARVLGKSLIASEQFFLLPGEKSKKIQANPPVDTRYIGIMAEYQELNKKKWRLILPMPAPKEIKFYHLWTPSPNTLFGQITASQSGLSAGIAAE